MIFKCRNKYMLVAEVMAICPTASLALKSEL